MLMVPLSQEEEESDEEADLMLGAKPFAIGHDGASAAPDPMALLGSAVGKPTRIDPSKPGADSPAPVTRSEFDARCDVRHSITTQLQKLRWCMSPGMVHPMLLNDYMSRTCPGQHCQTRPCCRQLLTASLVAASNIAQETSSIRPRPRLQWPPSGLLGCGSTLTCDLKHQSVLHWPMGADCWHGQGTRCGSASCKTCPGSSRR